jgi:hypothetical protein
VLRLLTIEEVQRRIPYSEDQLDRLVEKKILPPWVKFGPASNTRRHQFEHIIDGLLESLARERGIPLPTGGAA